MARKNRHQERDNHEAWAIPYGDLVTLLMAFFVVMYAISVVDAGKYRVLSNSLIEAFGAQEGGPPIQVGEPNPDLSLIGDEAKRSLAPIQMDLAYSDTGSGSASAIDGSSPTDVAIESLLDSAQARDRGKILSEIGEMAGEIESALGGLIEDDFIQVTRRPYWLEIQINTSLLFASGSATLETTARPVLEGVAGILAKRDTRIHVEGHTDDLPISNPIYPSNWELSSGRAATVVNLFAQHGIDPERMVAIGYAEFKPVAGNATEEGRARNRRVAVIVLPGIHPRSSERLEPERLRSDYAPDLGQIR